MSSYGVANPVSEYFLKKRLFLVCALKSQGALALLSPAFLSYAGRDKPQRIRLVLVSPPPQIYSGGGASLNVREKWLVLQSRDDTVKVNEMNFEVVGDF